ncbi:MAG: sulfite exporter TauE/SafE family protein [Lewinellaceae bacterium]|nr:sulfite exporter TauE/SafE family protein [Lewinellaceae bacterium]
MDLSAVQILIAFLGSFTAGVINTMAGNGSVITLSLLTDMIGLPGNIANGTNRVGILFQSMASLKGFSNFKPLQTTQTKLIATITVIGAIIGTSVAVTISNEAFLSIFKYLMILMLVVVLFKPERWLIQNQIEQKISHWILIPVFLIIGFYGGFIQMGMGIFFLGLLVLVGKYDIISANIIKTLVVSVFTMIILCIFAWKGLVRWDIGLLMAVGQSLGGFLTAYYGKQFKKIHIWAYRLLIGVIIVSIFIQFGILKPHI